MFLFMYESTTSFISRRTSTQKWSLEMSSAWGILPLGMDESDLMMLILALFILGLLIVAFFMTFQLHVALFFTAALILSLGYAIRETRKKAQIESGQIEE